MFNFHFRKREGQGAMTPRQIRYWFHPFFSQWPLRRQLPHCPGGAAAGSWREMQRGCSLARPRVRSAACPAEAVFSLWPGWLTQLEQQEVPEAIADGIQTSLFSRLFFFPVRSSASVPFHLLCQFKPQTSEWPLQCGQSSDWFFAVKELLASTLSEGYSSSSWIFWVMCIQIMSGIVSLLPVLYYILSWVLVFWL